MKLVSRKRYKIIIADNTPVPVPGAYSFTDFYFPIPPMYDMGPDQELGKAEQYMKDHYDSESDDSDQSDSDSEEDEEEGAASNAYVFPTFALHEDYHSDPIGKEELRELLEILNTIVRANPSLLRDSRPVIDIDISKYSLETATGEEYTWEVEYYIHEKPSVDDY